MSRRREPSPDAKARGQRIADALADLLPDPPAPKPAAYTPDDGDPYRAGPAIGTPAASGRAGLSCPGCEGPMEVVFQRQVELHRCAACDGLWLDPGELTTMTADTQQRHEADRRTLRKQMRAVSAGPQSVVYRKCPQCQTVMGRHNYGGESGVIMDRCQEHGVFLDPGEFEAIERFIELGGHDLAADHNEARAKSKQLRKDVDELAERLKPTQYHRYGPGRRLRSAESEAAVGSFFDSLFTWISKG